MPIMQASPAASLGSRKSIQDYTPLLFPPVECPLIPCGNRILVQVGSPLDKSDGGIILTGETQDFQKWTQKLAKVLKVGPLAYRDRTTFEPWPEGPWCKVGDYVRVGQYGGDRVEIKVPDDLTRYENHMALFATISDRDVFSVVPEGFDPLSLRGWF